MHCEQSPPTLGLMVKPSPVVRGMACHATSDGALSTAFDLWKKLAKFL